jgi:succinyl-diaminopimelate desuccinylase
MQEKLVSILEKLIAIPSVTSDPIACHDVLEYVRGEIEPLGLHITASPVEATHPWFYATTRNTLKPDILLAAHLDVVPAPAELFIMQRRDGKLYGRGTYDMKLAAACYIAFLKENANRLHTLNMGVLFTTDEEIGGDSMRDVIATGLRPNVIFIPDGGDNWEIEERAKGFFGVRLYANGKAAHGSRPWEGDNALHRIMDICHTLRSEYPFRGPEHGTLSITSIKGGEAVNQIADSASALMDFRSFDRDELSGFKTRLNELAESHGTEVHLTQAGDPVIFDKTNPAVQSFLTTYQSVRGEPAKYQDSYGGTDARYFVPYHVPCIIVEPNGGSRHSENEWVDLKSLEEYFELIERWVLSEKTTLDMSLDNAATLTV